MNPYCTPSLLDLCPARHRWRVLLPRSRSACECTSVRHASTCRNMVGTVHSAVQGGGGGQGALRCMSMLMAMPLNCTTHSNVATSARVLCPGDVPECCTRAVPECCTRASQPSAVPQSEDDNLRSEQAGCPRPEQVLQLGGRLRGTNIAAHRRTGSVRRKAVRAHTAESGDDNLAGWMGGMFVDRGSLSARLKAAQHESHW